MEGDSVVLEIYARAEPELRDSLLRACAIAPDSLAHYREEGQYSSAGWRIRPRIGESLRLAKALADFAGYKSPPREMLYEMAEASPPADPQYRFGYNLFRKPAVSQLPNGKTRFFLKVRGERPQSLYLSGSFNQWSTLKTPMRRCDSGYCAVVNLAPGAHYYKYVLNGLWLVDPRNRLTATDHEGNTNSVYFVSNHRFFLPGYADAESVGVAGTFNDWNPQLLPLEKVAGGWARNIYLAEGTHQYKFVADGQWLIDPNNSRTVPNEFGESNSLMALGDTVYFFLSGYPEAQSVQLAGSFTDWQFRAVPMHQTDTGWVLPYVLPAGNHAYKFLVDGEWQLDASHTLRIGAGDYENSVRVIKANHRFFLPGYANAEEVRLSGDFCQWAEPGYKMDKVLGGWEINLHLPPGKARYKFQVDGTWVLDPSNPDWEDNEFGTGNSVLWVLP